MFYFNYDISMFLEVVGNISEIEKERGNYKTDRGH